MTLGIYATLPQDKTKQKENIVFIFATFWNQTHFDKSEAIFRKKRKIQIHFAAENEDHDIWDAEKQ